MPLLVVAHISPKQEQFAVFGGKAISKGLK
jgi:hypothetical protein